MKKSARLYGSTEAEQLRADVAAETAFDVRTRYAELRFSPGWQDAAARAKYIADTAPAGFNRLERLLGDREWFATSGPTWADLLVFDTLDGHLAQWGDCLAARPALARFVARVAALPSLQAYLPTRRAA
jgi:glutathione S-transferase